VQLGWLFMAVSAALAADLPRPLPGISPKRHVCYRAPSAPIIDGRLDDRAWAMASWTEDFVDILGSARPASRFRTRAKVLWDDGYLYVAAEMEEPDVWGTLKQRDSVIYNDLLIAAHAITAGATLVTDNEREFSCVRDLVIENWLGSRPRETE
jgi:hypothetical protein